MESYTMSINGNRLVLLLKVKKKLKRIQELKNILSRVSKDEEPRFHYTLTKRLQVVTAMKEVLYSEIIKYSPQR